MREYFSSHNTMWWFWGCDFQTFSIWVSVLPFQPCCFTVWNTPTGFPLTSLFNLNSFHSLAHFLYSTHGGLPLAPCITPTLLCIEVPHHRLFPLCGHLIMLFLNKWSQFSDSSWDTASSSEHLLLWPFNRMFKSHCKRYNRTLHWCARSLQFSPSDPVHPWSSSCVSQKSWSLGSLPCSFQFGFAWKEMSGMGEGGVQWVVRVSLPKAVASIRQLSSTQLPSFLLHLQT